MRSIYLIARRDYLGYVQAWGFWVGIILTPLLLSIGMMAPGWAAASQPTRYYTVIEQGTTFSEMLRTAVDSERVQMTRMALDPVGLMNGDPSDKVDRFDAAIEAGATIEEALAEVGGSEVSVPQSDFVQVEPPARTEEAIRPYLLGQKLIETESGPQPLFAAIFVPEGEGEIEYWSENVTSQGLLSTVRTAERSLAEQRVFAEAGVSDPVRYG